MITFEWKLVPLTDNCISRECSLQQCSLTFVDVLEPDNVTDPAMLSSAVLVDMAGLAGCDY